MNAFLFVITQAHTHVHTCTKSKAIGIAVVITTKIARSQHLGIDSVGLKNACIHSSSLGLQTMNKTDEAKAAWQSATLA